MEKQPKYEYIKNALIEAIRAGKYAPGDELPSENDLTEEYHVSRITARRAIDELYRAGYIEKKQGKRGCVKETAKEQELTTISSYTEEILRQGMVPSRKVINSSLRLCTADEQDILQLDKTDAVFSMERIIYADGKPLCCTCTVLPYKYFRDIENFDFSEHSLYSIIEQQYQIKITDSVLKLKAIPAKENIAAYLDVACDVPLLYSSAITYGDIKGDIVPIETFQTYYLTDRFEYRLAQKR